MLLLGIAVFAVLAAIGGTYLGLRGGSAKSASEQVSGAPVTTALPTTALPTTASPTTASPPPAATNTVAPAASATTASPPTTAKSFAATSKPIAVAGGTFVVIGGEVSLTHVVAPGDTLFAISQWYKLMGGYAMLYKWNHSVIGSNPNLIFPGEVLTITVPGADIPRISPMWLAEAKAQAKARGLTLTAPGVRCEGGCRRPGGGECPGEESSQVLGAAAGGQRVSAGGVRSAQLTSGAQCRPRGRQSRAMMPTRFFVTAPAVTPPRRCSPSFRP